MGDNNYIDPEWTIQNDRQSVTVGINTRLWLCRKKGLQPTLIRLGRKHTRLFLRENALGNLTPQTAPQAQRYCGIPIKFNDTAIYGIAVESEPLTKPPQPRA